MLEKNNPWWSTAEWEKEDPDLRKYSKMTMRWTPRWIDEVSLEPFSLNFVVGPRQVGKTTGIKLLVRKLTSSGFEPRSILYLNCDLLASFRELRKVLEGANRFRFIFLDEVTGLEYWWRVVKGLIDLGYFENSVLVISGSSSLRLWKFTESFAGRRGKGKNVNVLPLSFGEFVQVTGTEPEKALQKYLQVGGFPRSLNEDPTFGDDLLLSLDRELARIGRSPRLAREILYEVLRKSPSAVSYQSLAGPLGISHVTVREYLEVLQDTFLVGLAFHKSGKHVDFKKEKKVFIRDPFLAQTLASVSGVSLREESLYEWVVQEHLLRKFGEVYYWRNKFEIDCVAGELKVEVKAGKPHRRYPRGVRIVEAEDLPHFLLELSAHLDLRGERPTES